jgi:predicted nuclease of predicted toxin-antitoxin system
MAIRLYMDHHVHRAITTGLRARGVDVLTALDDNASTFSDPALLERATAAKRVLFSQDDDLLAVAAKCQQQGRLFSGLVYAHQMHVSIGTCINHLELIAKIAEPVELDNQILFLPL